MMSSFTPKGLKWTYDAYARIPDDGRPVFRARDRATRLGNCSQ